jgi:hypothetical protein
MGLEDLNKAGVLLPKEEWGEHDIMTGVRKLPLLAVALLVPLSAALMYFGDGHALTWIGLVLFLVFLAGFTFLSLRGIR